MRRYFLLVPLFALALLVGPANRATAATRANDAPFEYLKTVAGLGPVQDPQILFLLMSQYLIANDAEGGIAYFSDMLQRYDHALSDPQRSLYLSALGLLRASHAKDVSLLRRIGWVKDTSAILDRAVRLSGGQVFIVRWIRGNVYAQLPSWFGKQETAFDDLAWCEANAEGAPHLGWLREVYFNLGRLQHDFKRDPARAGAYLANSGYTTFEKDEVLTTPNSNDEQTGHTFAPRAFKEVVPGRIYALSGFEFTEYYFVVSADRSQLFAVDAGTRPDSAKTAYDFLQSRVPGLPPLTAVFVTHAHWDHVGGHRFFRHLPSAPKFYARSNYQEELKRSLDAPVRYRYFFGSRFTLDDIRDFKPDVPISGPREISLGGTRIQFIPIQGGETTDGMFIFLPDESTLFAGDFIMPYFGAPFANEGNVSGLLDAIDIVAQLAPKHILHGHAPLTRVFGNLETLKQTRRQVAWLDGQVTELMREGVNRAAIHERNLIPPDIRDTPLAQMPLLLLRGNLIDRRYSQQIGYWRDGLEGMDHLSDKDFGSTFKTYLRLSDSQMADAVDRMIESGDDDLAARIVVQALEAYPDSSHLVEAKHRVFSTLRQKYQEFDPFRFSIYSELMAAPVPAVSTE
jgi:glyoxylase-like metal-dependent hydrolase (beta-lactamase superfamily II)